jgi:SAM-dependent methyltransferase
MLILMRQDRQAESKFFDDLATERSLDEFSKHTYVEVLEHLLDGLARGSRILDAGCGCGVWLWELQEMGFRALGVDISYNEVLQARERGLSAIVGDLLSLPCHVDSFDAVLLCGVLHHFPSAEERVSILRSASSILRPGGRVASIDPNGSNPFVRLGFHMHKEVSPNEVCLQMPQILGAFNEAGMKVLSVRTIEITQPRAPEGPLRRFWPALRKIAFHLSRPLGNNASGNYVMVRAVPKADDN